MDRDLPANVDVAERVSHRYHRIRVIVTLGVIGAVTMLIGIAGLLDPDNLHPVRYIAGCSLVAIVCGAAVLYLARFGGKTTLSVELAMLSGLVATCLNTIYGGVVNVDSWWQVCAYLIVILIAGGVSLRRWPSFGFFLGFTLVAWTGAILGSDEPDKFLFDSYILIVLGALVGGTILWLFRIERERVTELTRELQDNATHDALTGILNRHGLLIEARRRGSSGERAWCAYVDVDYFKSINDRRGHDHGDQVLEAVARSLAEVGGELTARWGGDEFVTLGFGLPPDEDTLQERVVRRMRTVEPGGRVTVGVASGRIRNDAEIDRLMTKADRRMYQRRAMARGERSPATA